MSLAASQALITNTGLRDRVTAAIRQTASQQLAWEGPAGVLARAAFARPDTAVDSFMLRLATNADVVKAACGACGNADEVPDDTIEWIVAASWEGIAAELFSNDTDAA